MCKLIGSLHLFLLKHCNLTSGGCEDRNLVRVDAGSPSRHDLGPISNHTSPDCQKCTGIRNYCEKCNGTGTTVL
jgi:hypothetical protein